MQRNSAPRRRSRVLPALAVLVVGGVLLGGSMFAGLLFGWFPSGTVTQDRSAPVVLQQLQDLARYKAASGQFSQVLDVEHDVRFVPDFLAGDRTVLVAVGSVDAEVDFSGLDGQHVTVSEDGKRVEIRLPPAELGEPRLDHEETHVASRQRGLANRIDSALTSNPDDDQKLMAQAQRSLTDAASGTELTGRAEANTRAMLTGLLTALGFDEVVITFDAPMM
jgi:hypothetical protein